MPIVTCSLLPVIDLGFILRLMLLLRLLRLKARDGLIESYEAAKALDEGTYYPLPPYTTESRRPVFAQARLFDVDSLNEVKYYHQDEPGAVVVYEKVGECWDEKQEIPIWRSVGKRGQLRELGRWMGFTLE